MALSEQQIVDGLPVFTVPDAKLRLRIHSFVADLDVHDEEMQQGFMGSLRPFTGLKERNFLELLGCLKTLGPFWSRANEIDREDISCFWGTCHLARVWAIESEGMLQRNKLISAEEIKSMESWLECLSYAVMSFLECLDPTEAFAPYVQHVLDPSH